MRASTQSVMYTLWSRSSVRTVSRSSVEWCPDSGATTRTAGSFFILSTVAWSSEKRLNRLRVQNGLAMATCSTMATSWPWACTLWISNSGFS